MKRSALERLELVAAAMLYRLYFGICMVLLKLEHVMTRLRRRAKVREEGRRGHRR